MARPPRSDDGLFESWEIARIAGVTETGATARRNLILDGWAAMLATDPARALRELATRWPVSMAVMQEHVRKWERRVRAETEPFALQSAR